MMEGFETESLIELAGISTPYNQFELKELTDKVFFELDLDYSNKREVVTNYASYLVKKGLEDKSKIDSILKELMNLCIELDYYELLYDFYSLYFAKEDLKYDTIQHYRNGADRENIDEISTNYFQKWIKSNPLTKFTHEE